MCIQPESGAGQGSWRYWSVPFQFKGENMKKWMFCFLIPVLAQGLPRLRSADALLTHIDGNTFIAELKPGFHFNDKAPNGLQLQDQLIKPSTLEKNKLVIANLPAQYKKGSVSLYVCDDAVTFCEVHNLSMGEQANSASSKADSFAAAKINSHGFILNDFTEALKQAEKKNKNVIVDFGARWCPPCLRLESEIFPAEKFRKKSANFIKLKIDVDLFSNFPLLNRYAIKGYPTILFLTTKGEEITRFTDYQPMTDIILIIADVQKFPIPLKDLEKPEYANELKNGLWKRYFESGQFQKALAVLETLEVKPKEYLWAKIQVAASQAKEDPAQKENYISALKNAIATESDSSRSILWRASLARELPENSKELDSIVEQSNALTQKLLKDPEALKKAIATDSLGEFSGLEHFYISFMNAGIGDSAKKETIKAWQLAVVEGKKAKISAQQPGVALRLLTAMIEAQNYPEAAKLVDQLLKAKPKDGDLQRRKTRVLVEQKKFPEAVALGEKALKNSYGTNEFYVLEPLIKAYRGTEQNQKAKDLIGKYLAKNEINFAEMKSYKKKLEVLNQELNTVK